MVLNKQTLLPNLFQTPPDALHIFWSHRPIGFIEINPETHALCHGGKCINVACYRFTALIVKWCDAIFFNIAFSCKTKFLLYCNLNRKSVAIPTCFTSDVFALHCLIARKYIFKYTRFNMVSTRHSICSGRAFIKCPWSSTSTRFSALMEDVILAPEI
ncbi:unannotated protein [freshwater metagenome]|uniref:Unannotated protein n=1 Tax=freshwater metagenome TaxID=449393 RepID=A0A6J6S235_9ZZZZ